MEYADVLHAYYMPDNTDLSDAQTKPMRFFFHFLSEGTAEYK